MATGEKAFRKSTSAIGMLIGIKRDLYNP